MIRVLGIDHVVLRTTDLPAMLEFYCATLGCVVERELPELGLVQLRAGAALIDLVPVDSELGRQGGGPPAADAPNMEHLCLSLAPCGESELLAWLTRHGISGGDFATRYGAGGFGRSLYVKDPQGNTVELKLAASESQAG